MVERTVIPMNLKQTKYRNLLYWIPVAVSVVLTLVLIWFLPGTLAVQFTGGPFEGVIPTSFLPRWFALVLPAIHVGYLFLAGLPPVDKREPHVLFGPQKFWRGFHWVMSIILFLGQLCILWM